MAAALVRQQQPPPPPQRQHRRKICRITPMLSVAAAASEAEAGFAVTAAATAAAAAAAAAAAPLFLRPRSAAALRPYPRFLSRLQSSLSLSPLLATKPSPSPPPPPAAAAASYLHHGQDGSSGDKTLRESKSASGEGARLGEGPRHWGGGRHCPTCSCDGQDQEASSSENNNSESQDDEDNGSDSASNGSSNPLASRLMELLRPKPPLAASQHYLRQPAPAYSVRRRVLPSHLVSLNSAKGQGLLVEALGQGTAASYLPLTLHFCNQSDPAFCGITTLLVCLNAMSIDPQTRWKGGWRYFGDEESLLARCCLEPERIRSEGINLDEFGRLAACQGLLVKTRRATATTAAQKENGSLDDFRRDVVAALTIQDDGVGGEAEDDGRYDGGDGDEDDGASRTPSRLVVASFGRSGLSQTGDGHFSPLAAYHAGSDRVLVLDVARFKYPPYWVGAKELHAAMALKDESTGRPRGWIVLENRRRRGRSKRSLLLPSSSFLSGGADADEEGRRSGDSGEDRRPARLVPPQQQASWCPMHKAKVEYCENQRRVTPASFGEGYGGGAEGRGGGASQ